MIKVFTINTGTSSGGVTGANNGLTVVGGNAQLGGANPLIQFTQILIGAFTYQLEALNGGNNAVYDWSFNNSESDIFDTLGNETDRSQSATSYEILAFDATGNVAHLTQTSTQLNFLASDNPAGHGQLTVDGSGFAVITVDDSAGGEKHLSLDVNNALSGIGVKDSKDNIGLLGDADYTNLTKPLQYVQRKSVASVGGRINSLLEVGSHDFPLYTTPVLEDQQLRISPSLFIDNLGAGGTIQVRIQYTDKGGVAIDFLAATYTALNATPIASFNIYAQKNSLVNIHISNIVANSTYDIFCTAEYLGNQNP